MKELSQNDTPVSEVSMSFDDFGLNKNILQCVKDAGFITPSPIQKKAIPLIMQGKDIIGQAHTGTGKTAAFGLPSLSRMKHTGGVEMLVITPTRELATQVSDELYSYGKLDGVRSVTIYGGQSYRDQLERVERGAQLVVATPGRLLDILQSGKMRKFHPSIVVLDEADEMLDMGFLEDIKNIFTFLPENRQTLMFSATMPAPIRELAKKILKDPIIVSVTDAKEPNRDIEERYCVIEEFERDEALMRLIDSEEVDKSIIFCRTKKEVDRLSTALMGRGYLAKGLHGDMEQNQRNEVIKSFQGEKIKILIATDVAARGLDIRGVSHVFNFHIPFEAESYVHRIGRTGRAGKKGIAITFVTPREFRDLKRIKHVTGSNIVHSPIPTLQELKKLGLAKLFETLKDQKIHTSSKDLLKLLIEEMGPEPAMEKIMSYILDQESVSGPERIGIDGERLHRMLGEMNNRYEDRGNSSFQRRRPPFRGPRRSY